jgi:lysophospholipase L1-like esterase
MKLFCFTIFLFFNAHTIYAQANYDSSFRFYYYDQKLSMFKTMPDGKKEIVWLGDSITDGGEWSELFPKQNTLNRGISSDNTFGVLNRLHEVLQRKPKKVFLLIGINDIARTIPNEVIIANMGKIIDSFKIQSANTKLYIQSILPTNNAFTDFKNHQNKTEHIDKVNAALKELCKQQQIDFVDLQQAFKDEDGKLDKKYTNDGLHLTGAGYQQWKNYLITNSLLK